MAVVIIETTGTAHAAQRVAARLRAALAAARAVIDSYVSYRMQTSASEAERSRQPAAGIATLTGRPVQAEYPSIHTEDEDTGRALQPLDPGTISDAIPAFFVGRNHDGIWVAREAKGAIGGTFLLRDSATSFARRHSGSTGCATIFPAERFELDIANSGNPLAALIGQLLRFVRRMWRSVAAPSGATRRH
jgi:hypothetical protein